VLVDELLAWLAEAGYRDLEIERVATETLVFSLPAALGEGGDGEPSR
jgi:hypothetical protein